MQNSRIENPASDGIGMPGRLGNVVYWVCTALAVVTATVLGGLTLLYPFVYGLNGIGYSEFVWSLVINFGTAGLFYLFGRAVRYILAGR